MRIQLILLKTAVPFLPARVLVPCGQEIARTFRDTSLACGLPCVCGFCNGFTTVVGYDKSLHAVCVLLWRRREGGGGSGGQACGGEVSWYASADSCRQRRSLTLFSCSCAWVRLH